MAHDITNVESAGDKSVRIRPHWWAVLAVSLSLLALVAAATRDHSSNPGDRPGVRASLGPQKKEDSTPPVTSGAAPTTSPNTVTPTTSGPAGKPVATTGSAHVVVRQALPPTTTTTSTTSTAGGSSTVAAQAQPATPTQTWTGDLQQPDDASATYTFTGAGSMQVSVSWPSTVPLSLSVTCPAGTWTGNGSSAITVALPNATGACDLTLKETIVQYDAVAYTLTVGPSDGG